LSRVWNDVATCINLIYFKDQRYEIQEKNRLIQIQCIQIEEVILSHEMVILQRIAPFRSHEIVERSFAIC